jgi:hypothetical protein
VEMPPGSVVGCVGNIINTTIVVRFHFFCYLANWVKSNLLWDVFWETWGSLFLIYEILGVGLKFNDFLGRPWGDPG